MNVYLEVLEGHEPEMGLFGLKFKCWQDFDPLGHSRGQVYPLCYFIYIGHHHSWAHGLSSIFKPRCIAFLTAYLTTLLLSHF